MEGHGEAMQPAPAIDGAAVNERYLGDSQAATTNAGSSIAEQQDSTSTSSNDASLEPNPIQRTISGRGSVPFSSLDPNGTSELTRRLTEHSLRARTRTTDGGEAAVGFDPFDKNGNFELERFLRHVLDQAEGAELKSRQMGLVWQGLTVTGLGTGYALADTVGTLPLKPFEVIKNINSLLHPPVKTIIDNFEGCVKPGEMLLVLGRPGAGCTSFLKTIASYRDGFKEIKGTVLYEGMDHTVIDKRLRGDVVYSPEDDVHFPTLTVHQTLSFAVAARAPQARRRLDLLDSQDTNTREGYIKTLVEVFATILGLKHTYNTKVGNDFVRGVSGGERKRVSVAETFASRAKVALFDNSSRGLDSSTALEFVKALRISTDITNSTTMASIYQAGEGLTQLFDKVLVINEGRQVYMGPMSEAANYFNEMGYEAQDRQTTADFLVACTDALGSKVRAGYEKRAPRTADEMAQYWRNSPQGRKNHEEVEAYLHELKTNVDDAAIKHYKEIAREEKAKHTRKGSPYIISLPMQVRLAIKRRAQIIWGDIATQLVITLASIFQALITGSVFYQMPKNTSGFFSRGGVLFFALLYNSFTALSEITAGYAQRPIVIRHRRFGMVHPFSDAIANTLIDIPIRIFTLIFFDILIYFMTGLAYTADQFFVFFGITALVTLTMVAFFRMLAAMTKSESLATMLGGLAVIDLALYAGYVIPRPSMVVWWKWLSYANPVAYAFEILLTNEFRRLNVPCGNLIPNGAGYANVANAYKVCPVASAVAGQDIINGSDYLAASFQYHWSNRGRNVGIIFAFWIFFLFVYLVASEFQGDPTAAGGVMVYSRDGAPKEVLNATKASGDVEAGDAAAGGPAEGDTHEEEGSDEAVGKLESSTSVFAWKDVNYDVLIKGNPRRLLNNVSGFVAPGKMTALMGESGAGKTTLLNVLAQRTDTGVVQGDFTVNGAPLPKSFQSATGYCQQQDVHMATQTVREALQFSALLRQPRETPKAEKLAYVENVIEMLEMQTWAGALVGEVGMGLNVEQRKRLTIAVELAAKPKLLLFLDEPTSGLDAMAAWSIVRFLRKLADAGQAILCTIHQPSGELFNQFDRLLLLQKGGKTVYFADIGKNSQKLVDYFGERSGKRCGSDDNPAEYILDVIGAGATANTDKDWHQLYLDSELYTDMHKTLREIAASGADHQVTAEEEAMDNREYAEPLLVQVRLVVGRAFTHYWRDTTYIMSKLGLNIIGGLFIGSSFWGQGAKDNTASLQNKIFAIFMALVLSTSLSQQLQPVFIQFRALYEARERPSKMYSWWVAVWAALIVEVPWNLLGGTLFWACWYWMIKFPADGKTSALVWGFYMLFQIYYQTFAAAIAAMSPNPMIASILFSTFFSFVIIFCGVVQPPPQMPYFWRKWMFPLSPFTWLVEGMLGAVLNDRPVRCAQNEFNTITPPPGQTCAGYLGNFVTTLNGPNLGTGYYENGPNGECNYCEYRVGNDYLNSITLNAANRFRDIGFICAYIVFNIFLCFVLFYFFRVFRLSDWKKSDKKTASKQQQATPAENKTAGNVAASKVNQGGEKATEAINETSAGAKGSGQTQTHEPLPTSNLFGGAGQPGNQGVKSAT